MPNDRIGRPLRIGDHVCVRGRIVRLMDTPDNLNLIMETDVPMQTSGQTFEISVNSSQVRYVADDET